MSLKKKLLLFLDLLGICALIALDQYTKYLAVIHLKDKPAYNIINGVLELNYLENKGAAFGMLQNQKAFFIFVAVVTLSVIGYVLFKVPDRKKYGILHLLLSLIAAGAIGNMIDRIRFDYVVDFIYFVLINFPIFNVADIYVTVSTVVLVFLLLFVYKENDLSFISFKQKRYREVK
ncbi:MAG: signal peptidase II [Lachnospiraceae bacterium]|nr:signal peptidase II [Lachnospiraceae bacterium]MBD5502187.1 signal peptidase II [Lachnospiraceae bacterium]MDE7260141.1 signal peptidase II [Lachnospiraceae bacterium]